MGHGLCTRYSERLMDVTAFLGQLRRQPFYQGQIVHLEQIGRRSAKYGALSTPLHPDLQASLRSQGIERLFSHQAEAVNAARAGRHLVVVTSTASGKTLCYNLPVLEAILAQPTARALYLFPTKALAQDQLRSLRELGCRDLATRQTGFDTPQTGFDTPQTGFDTPQTATQPTATQPTATQPTATQPTAGKRAGFALPVSIAAYDGDTSQARRARLRQQGQIILTNPDMLHVGILPNHALWAGFFRHLRYVVVDEAHIYRGIFGSQVACVLRRLRRVGALYGVQPQFIAASATIANPGQHIAALTGLETLVIDDDGSPSGPRARSETSHSAEARSETGHSAEATGHSAEARSETGHSAEATGHSAEATGHSAEARSETGPHSAEARSETGHSAEARSETGHSSEARSETQPQRGGSVGDRPQLGGDRPQRGGEQGGLRRSANGEATQLFTALVRHDIRTIVFTRARKVAELILRYARAELSKQPKDESEGRRGRNRERKNQGAPSDDPGYGVTSYRLRRPHRSLSSWLHP
jgi:ATP-dependent helicase YprA (DUF1998 family)